MHNALPTNPSVPFDEQAAALDVPALPLPLPSNTVLTAPDGLRLHLRAWRGNAARCHTYEASTPDGQPVWLIAASEAPDAARLHHQAQVLTGLESPLWPQYVTCFTHADVTYLGTRPVSTAPTLATVLASGVPPLPQVLTVLTQVAVALSHLHAHGWAHLGLRPQGISLGKPLTLTDLTYATRLGERPASPFYHTGYSAPELLSPDSIDARADVYAVGALLYHALSGQPIHDTGAELSTWFPPTPVAGVPQILARCLGPREARYASMTALHQDLLRLARRSAPQLHYASAAASSIGLDPSRTTNQDAYALLTGTLESDSGPQHWAVVGVADGMGGMAAGEVASAVAIGALVREAATTLTASAVPTPEALPEHLRRWVHSANTQVCAALQARQARGGTTLVCAVLLERHLALAHVGDSRLYLLHQGDWQPLTRDHSLAMALVQQGEVRLEALRQHPDRNQLTRSLGERPVLPEYFIDTHRLELSPGDLLLLCSDGLWEPLHESAMQAIVQQHAPDLHATAQALLHQALQCGGPDNATVVLLRLDTLGVLTREGPGGAGLLPAVGAGETPALPGKP